MYAIAFDLTISDLEKYYGKQYHNAYSEIKNLMEKNGFFWIQGSTYITEESLISVTKTINTLNKVDWFKKSVRDIRAFRIEDWSDFTPIFKEDL